LSAGVTRRNEAGQVFPLVLIILTLGSILVAGFLASVNSGLLTIDIYTQSVTNASNAEDIALDSVMDLLDVISPDEIGDNITYEINGVPVTITVVTGADIPPAEFTSGGFVDNDVFSDWSFSEQHTSFTEEPPGSGEYIFVIEKQAYLQFTVNLTDYSGLALRVYARLSNPGSSSNDGYLVFEYSTDGLNWVEAAQWFFSAENTDYQYYTADLSSDNITAPFRVRFTPVVSKGNPEFDVQEIEVSTDSAVTIYATVGDTTVEIPVE